MTTSRATAVLCACLLLTVTAVSGQDYIAKGYNPPPLSGATTCQKGIAGNTPATCPYPLVPRTDEGKDGSTTCVTALSGKSYEGVISLMYPAPNAVPWCTSDSQCGSNPSVICATQGPTGSGNTCFPLAPSGCPFKGDVVNSTAGATAGRRFMY